MDANTGHDTNQEWITKRHKKYSNSKQNPHFDMDNQSTLAEFNNLNSTPDDSSDGSHIILPHKYVFWTHDSSNKNWNLSSYNQVCTIETVADFWKLYNNLSKIFHKTHLFLMKDGINPIWEDDANKNGGFCSFKTELNNSLDIYEDLSVRLICHKIISNPDELNGISISPKYNSSIIKIWNRNCDYEFLNKLDTEISNKYQGCSIKYIKNIPEY